MHAINTCFGKICKIPTSAWRYLLLQGNLAAVAFSVCRRRKGKWCLPAETNLCKLVINYAFMSKKKNEN